ncbi:MAG: alpha-amylase family glycosyl hydrolase, partial [Dethiobacteria bacterium]
MLTGADWWRKAVFYQVYPRSFYDSNGDGIGDLAGIIEKLDYLNDGTPGSLGIDAIWFSPFFKSPEYDFGYDVADYCEIDPRFGTLEDFDRLVAEAHRRGIRVILDLVVNHTSHEHPWFKESRSSRDNPKRDWYIWRDGVGPRRRPPNNWRNNFFGPAWTWDETTEQYYLHSFLPQQPDLNWFNPEVRRAIDQVIRFWLDRGADGFRLDVAHLYCKDEQLRSNPPFFRRDKVEQRMPFTDRTWMMNLFSLFSLPEFQVKKYNQHHPETHRVLKEFRKTLDEYPEKTSVGEILGEDPQVIASYYGSGNDELHMNFYFDLAHC